MLLMTLLAEWGDQKTKDKPLADPQQDFSLANETSMGDIANAVKQRLHLHFSNLNPSSFSLPKNGL